MRRRSKWAKPPVPETGPPARGRIRSGLGRVVAPLRSGPFLAIGLAAVVALAVPAAAGRGLRPAPARAHPARAAHPAPAATAQPAAPAGPQPDHVLFVGASITTGAEQTSIDSTFPGLVVTGLRDRGLDVDWTERAKWGAYIPDALSWPYPADQQVIVVHLITNDFIRGTPLATYRADLQQLLVDLRDRSPQAELLCLGTWDTPGALNRFNVSEATYDATARETCEQESGRFVPLSPIFAESGSRGPLGKPTPYGPADNFHPNDVGAQRIATAVLTAIPTPTPPVAPTPTAGAGRN